MGAIVTRAAEMVHKFLAEWPYRERIPYHDALAVGVRVLEETSRSRALHGRDQVPPVVTPGVRGLLPSDAPGRLSGGSCFCISQAVQSWRVETRCQRRLRGREHFRTPHCHVRPVPHRASAEQLPRWAKRKAPRTRPSRDSPSDRTAAVGARRNRVLVVSISRSPRKERPRGDACLAHRPTRTCHFMNGSSLFWMVVIVFERRNPIYSWMGYDIPYFAKNASIAGATRSDSHWGAWCPQLLSSLRTSA